jgi:hypothetical protein
VIAASPPAVQAPARLCGWWVNPTPGNFFLLDGKRDHLFARQGEDGPTGGWPRFSKFNWVYTGHAGYGYGCASLKVVWNGGEVSRIVSASALPLASCRHNPRLRRAERLARP